MAPRFARLAVACTAAVAARGHNKDVFLCDDAAACDAASQSGADSAMHLLQTASQRNRLRNGLVAYPWDMYVKVGPAATVAGLASQQTCSLRLLAGRDNETYRSTEFRNYVGSAKDLVVEEAPAVVTSSFKGASVAYSYQGPRFGCVRVEGSEGLPGRSSSSALREASAAIDQLAEQTASRGALWPAATWPSSEVPQAVLDFVEANIDDPFAYAVLVSYKGVLVERYNEGFTQDSLLHGWSIAKSVLSMLLGVRSNEGKIDISSYVSAPEVSQEEKVRRNMTIENVLAMHVGDPLEENLGTPPDLWQAYSSAAYGAAGEPRYHVKAGDFYYSSGNTNLNSRELRQSFGDGAEGLQKYLQYPWEALFSRIGASSMACEVDPSLTFVLSSFCYATARDFMKLAQLVLHRGAWGNEQVVPADWMDWSTSPSGSNHLEYARGWWRLEAMFPEAKLGTPVISALGTLGQYSLAVPEHDLLITRLGSKDGKTLEWMSDPSSGKNSLHQLLQSLPK